MRPGSLSLTRIQGLGFRVVERVLVQRALSCLVGLGVQWLRVWVWDWFRFGGWIRLTVGLGARGLRV